MLIAIHLNNKKVYQVKRVTPIAPEYVHLIQSEYSLPEYFSIHLVCSIFKFSEMCFSIPYLCSLKNILSV